MKSLGSVCSRVRPAKIRPRLPRVSVSESGVKGLDVVFQKSSTLAKVLASSLEFTLLLGFEIANNYSTARNKKEQVRARSDV